MYINTKQQGLKDFKSNVKKNAAAIISDISSCQSEC